MKKSSLSATELRKHLFEVLEQIQEPTSPFRLITKDGEIKAVLLSMADWEAWQETLEVITDSRLLRGIQEGMEDFRRGHVYSHEDVFGPTKSARSSSQKR